MCLVLAPATLAALSLATSVASAGVGLAGKVVAANQTNQFYNDNAREANRAAADQNSALINQLLQKRAAADQQLADTSIQGLRARGTARAAAGEAGVTGLSVDALVGDYFAAEGRRDSSINANYQMDKGYVTGQLDSIHHQAQARINSAPRAQVGMLDILGAGIQAATGALGAGTFLSKATRKATGGWNGPYPSLDDLEIG